MRYGIVFAVLLVGLVGVGLWWSNDGEPPTVGETHRDANRTASPATGSEPLDSHASSSRESEDDAGDSTSKTASDSPTIHPPVLDRIGLVSLLRRAHRPDGLDQLIADWLEGGDPEHREAILDLLAETAGHPHSAFVPALTAFLKYSEPRAAVDDLIRVSEVIDARGTVDAAGRPYSVALIDLGREVAVLLQDDQFEARLAYQDLLSTWSGASTAFDTPHVDILSGLAESDPRAHRLLGEFASRDGPARINALHHFGTVASVREILSAAGSWSDAVLTGEGDIAEHHAVVSALLSSLAQDPMDADRAAPYIESALSQWNGGSLEQQYRAHVMQCLTRGFCPRQCLDELEAIASDERVSAQTREIAQRAIDRATGD